MRAVRLHVGVLAMVLMAAAAARARAEDPTTPSATRTVSELARDLGADDPAVRRSAAQALGGRWPDAARFVPALIELLDDEDDGAARSARAALDGLGSRAAPEVGAWFASVAAKPWGPDDEAWATETLRSLDEVGLASTTPVEIAGVLDSAETPGRRRIAVAILGSPAMSESAERLASAAAAELADDPHLGELARCLCALHGASVARRGADGARDRDDAIPAAWLAGLRSGSGAVRSLAADLLGHRGPGGDAARKAVEVAFVSEYARKSPSETLLRRLAFAFGAQRAGEAAGAFPPAEWADDPTLVAAFADGLCRFAEPAAVATLLDRPWSARAALHRLAALPETPAEAEATLRRIVREGGDGCLPAAAVLSRRTTDSPDEIATLDARTDESLGRKDHFEAFRTSLAACFLAGAPPDRLSRLRTLVSEYPTAADVAAHHLPAWVARPGIRAAELARGLPNPCAGLDPSKRRGGDDSSLDVPAVLELLEPLEPSHHTAPVSFRGRADVWVHDAWRVRALRAVALLGDPPAELVQSIEGLRDGPDARLRVVAARALRAVRAR